MKKSNLYMKKVLSVMMVLMLVTGLFVIPKITANAAETTTVTVTDNFIVLKGVEATQKITATANNNSSITYKSSNVNVATVSADGTITPLTYGLTDITLQAGDTATTVKVTVVPKKDKTNRIKVAVQMYNMLVAGDLGVNPTKDQVVNVLRNIAAFGYDGVEWANLGITNSEQFYGIDPTELKGIMDELGLETAASHYHLPWLNGSYGTSLKQVIDANAALGNKKIIFAYSTPATFGEGITNKQWSDKINEVLASMKEAAEGTDIKVLYHNHGAEMQPISSTDSTVVLDTLNAEAFEVDVYWASVGLGDTNHKNIDAAIQYITERASKINLLHIKDGNGASPAQNDMASWGIGNFPIQKIIDVARANNIEWVVVENDRPIGSAVTDAGTSMRYIQNNLKLTYLSDINEAKVAVKAKVTFTGSALKPSITVTYKGIVLQKDIDYTVSYKDNKKVGKATVTITGTGNYKGSKLVNFQIVSKK